MFLFLTAAAAGTRLGLEDAFSRWPTHVAEKLSVTLAGALTPRVLVDCLPRMVVSEDLDHSQGQTSPRMSVPKDLSRAVWLFYVLISESKCVTSDIFCWLKQL